MQLDRGWITVDDRMATNVPGIYAIGDVTGKLPLAHVATAMGEVAVEVIAGEEPEPLNYVNMPKPVYTHPQIASLGLTEAQAREQGYEVQVGTFPLQASGKALALGDHNGFAQIVADAQYGEVLGAHLIGPEATELLAEVGAVQLPRRHDERVRSSGPRASDVERGGQGSRPGDRGTRHPHVADGPTPNPIPSGKGL